MTIYSIDCNFAGATFFSESVNMNDQELLQPILESFGGFKKVQTVPLFTFHIFFTLVLDIVAIVYAAIHPDDSSKCREYFIIIYLHVALWIITYIIHIVTKTIHFNIRLSGYLDFYKETETHSGLPLIIVSVWTVALLFVQTLMQHFYPDNFYEKCIHGGTMSPKAYLCALITLEFCVITGVNINYINKVMQFNKQQAPPDVLKSEWTNAAEVDGVPHTEVGYREMGSKVYELLEKQADLIQYLKEHNARLNEKVMTLSNQISQGRVSNEISGGSGVLQSGSGSHQS
ncbi:transmembrane protein 192 isoform X2 [Anthonomus grandis grandis]|uniref:transmembrane protein 192 isoform X2 n=1 Tax=Anthonomus grandis grandis TaxID=2921223 RepID=UPI002165619A|nr:transmembrane protein 192 isoform X2 [Anthonomus grandis grandis]